MKNLLRALVLLMLVTGVGAQAQTTTTAPQKRVVKIDDSTGELVDITQAQEAVQATGNAPGIVILNNQKSSQDSAQVSGQASHQKSASVAVQDQPAQVIEDTPLSTSAAERRRRERQGLEMQTEQKIVEKLEDARMEDEKSRSERLFNKGFSSRDQQQEAPVAPVATPAPQQVQIIQAAPVVREEPKVNVKEEIRAALEEMKPKEPTANTFYIQGLVGVGEYPDASNMRGNMSMGFAVGVVTPERIVAEGAFQYSQFDINRNQGYNFTGMPFSKMSQYNFQGALKYQLLGGKIRPVVGAIAGYTYRSYESQQYGYIYSNAYSPNNNSSTNALDVGALVGLDVQLTTSFSIGADFRYMKNVAFRENSDYSNAYSAYGYTGKRVEEFNYYLGSLVGKFTF